SSLADTPLAVSRSLAPPFAPCRSARFGNLRKMRPPALLRQTGCLHLFQSRPVRRERFTTPSPSTSAPRTIRTDRNFPPVRELGRVHLTKALHLSGAAQLLRLEFSCWHVPRLRSAQETEAWSHAPGR